MGGASTNGWAESVPLVGIELTDLPNIGGWGAHVGGGQWPPGPTPVPASLCIFGSCGHFHLLCFDLVPVLYTVGLKSPLHSGLKFEWNVKKISIEFLEKKISFLFSNQSISAAHTIFLPIWIKSG